LRFALPTNLQKTTILYKLKLGEIVTTIPTIGRFQEEVLGACASSPLYALCFQSDPGLSPTGASGERTRMMELR
jgi:hypothetical protein